VWAGGWRGRFPPRDRKGQIMGSATSVVLCSSNSNTVSQPAPPQQSLYCHHCRGVISSGPSAFLAGQVPHPTRPAANWRHFCVESYQILGQAWKWPVFECTHRGVRAWTRMRDWTHTVSNDRLSGCTLLPDERDNLRETNWLAWSKREAAQSVAGGTLLCTPVLLRCDGASARLHY